MNISSPNIFRQLFVAVSLLPLLSVTSCSDDDNNQSSNSSTVQPESVLAEMLAALNNEDVIAYNNEARFTASATAPDETIQIPGIETVAKFFTYDSISANSAVNFQIRTLTLNATGDGFDGALWEDPKIVQDLVISSAENTMTFEFKVDMRHKASSVPVLATFSITLTYDEANKRFLDVLTNSYLLINGQQIPLDEIVRHG